MIFYVKALGIFRVKLFFNVANNVLKWEELEVRSRELRANFFQLFKNCLFSVYIDNFTFLFILKRVEVIINMTIFKLL